MDTDTPAAAAAAPAAAAAANGVPPPAPELSAEMRDKLTKLRDILSGKTPIALNLEFLYMHNKADLQVRMRCEVQPAVLFWDTLHA
jgi:26S proteasome regulatory subunit N2